MPAGMVFFNCFDFYISSEQLPQQQMQIEVVVFTGVVLKSIKDTHS